MSIETLLPTLRSPVGGTAGLAAAAARTNQALLRVQTQLALGRAMLSASDDPSRSAALARLQASLRTSLHRADLLTRGRTLLEASDSPIGSAIDLLGEAKSLASSDAVLNLSAEERLGIAAQIDEMVMRLVSIGNSRFDGVALFGGSRSRSDPFTLGPLHVLYRGRGEGLDIGLGEPVTLSGDRIFGGVSRRIDLHGSVNLSQGWETPLAAWGAGPLGQIMVIVDGQSRIVDLSGAATLRDLRNALEGLDMGIRVEFDAASGKAWVRNARSGSWMSISDRPGDDTASRLGIDTFARYTLLSDFNDGRGVRFAVPGVDPVTGLPANLNGEDLSIRLHDGRAFHVDFTAERTVGEVIDTIHAAAIAAGIAVPADFHVTLRTDGNGLVVIDNTVGPELLTIAAYNGSYAAEDLGIQGSTSGAFLTGLDRAQVAVDGAFHHLIRLREAIRTADAFGMKVALEGLDRAIERASLARGAAGARSDRLASERAAMEETTVQQQSLLSLLQDVDVAEAATRLSELSTQLTAGLVALSRAGSLTLLRFLA